MKARLRLGHLREGALRRTTGSVLISETVGTDEPDGRLVQGLLQLLFEGRPLSPTPEPAESNTWP